jgi:alpha 1,3-glucosidase
MGFKSGGLVLLAMAMAPSLTWAVDRNNFKTCDQSSFCKRNRNLEVSVALPLASSEKK